MIADTARARPDGYTIELGSASSHMLNGAFYSLPHDVLNDFAPVSPLAAGPQILCARKTMPATDLNGLIAWLKANPNKSSAGFGTSSLRRVTAYFQTETRTQFSPSYRIVAARPQYRTSSQARSTCYSTH